MNDFVEYTMTTTVDAIEITHRGEIIASFPNDNNGERGLDIFIKGVLTNPNASVWCENFARYVYGSLAE